MLKCFRVLVTTQMSMNAPVNHVRMAASARINQEVTDALVLVVGLQERTVMKVDISLEAFQTCQYCIS